PGPAPRPDALFRVVLVEHNPGGLPSPLRAELGHIEGVLIETRGSLAGLRARARRGGIDLVVMELELPDSRGVETARTAAGALTGVPLIALVGELTDEIAAGCAALGVACVQGGEAGYERLRALIAAYRG
ncbi:MAG: hypothetical protein ABIO70_01385, partial [Pseudomonadota bacterium]